MKIEIVQIKIVKIVQCRLSFRADFHFPEVYQTYEDPGYCTTKNCPDATHPSPPFPVLTTCDV